jgi:hypothetical protein
MDVLLLIMACFGIMVVASYVASRRLYRKESYYDAERWNVRLRWFIALTCLTIIAWILPHLGFVSHRVVAAHYLFSLMTFGLMVGAGSLVTSIIDETELGLVMVVILSAIVIFAAGFCCLVISILSDLIFGVSPIYHLVVGLFGLWVGLRPAIKRHRAAKALTRAIRERSAQRSH